MNKNKNKNKNNKNEESLNKQFSPQSEEKILEFWEKNKIFEKSVAKRKGKKEFVFYEGPPYANGKPGIHHIEARSFKDIILRYKSLKGYYTPRKAGWDTHGLPTEMEVEKKLGIKSKREIEEVVGIKKFVEEARENVFLYKDEWEKMTKRIAYWLDLENAYVTMENYYIENLWRAVKEISNKKLLYEDYKVLPWCARCGTALSHHEVAQGYKTITDKSVIVKFQTTNNKLQTIFNFQFSNEKTYILAWTTTPWTLPGNVALAVGESIVYLAIKIKNKNEVYVLAKDRLGVISEEYEVLKEIKGKDLIGLEYSPLFDVSELKNDKSYKIYGADFVNTENGTGVVHTAVMYGDDDYKLGKKIGLPMFHTVSPDGKFINSLKNGFAGMYVKSKETEEKIINYLKENELLFESKEYSHDYPHCWRCQNPLLYYAKNSWFFKTTAVKQSMIKENNSINWRPEYLKKGRFGEWLKDVRDWAISRERYWGMPLPIWKCGVCENIELIGNIEELKNGSVSNGNEFYIMRHGESNHNVNKIADGIQEKSVSNLTKRGIKQVEKNILALKKKGIKFDFIISSDFLRCAKTSEIAKIHLGISEIIFDKRLREINVGIFEGKLCKEYHKYYNSFLEKFEKTLPEGESLNDLKARIWDFLKDINEKYQNKKILIVGHEYPLWILSGVARGLTDEEIIKLRSKNKDFVNLAEIKKLNYVKLPLNVKGDLDLHRPYVDEIKLKCKKCKGEAIRVKEVADVWFDSGAMPTASLKFKSQISNFKNLKNIPYPADYICEGIDQTRGWFYTLLAVSSLLGMKAPYKNVISLGLVLDAKGQKMSKSRGNTVNPWELLSKHGADSIRWYFYTINQPWDDKLFKEKDIEDAKKGFINILFNSFAYFKTYAGKKLKITGSVKNPKLIINKWLMIKFNILVKEAGAALDNYDVVLAARKINEFVVEDISHWYIRRIRDIMKNEKSAEAKETKVIFGKILNDLSVLIAPFTPFIAEEIYLGVSPKKESAHLEDYPVFVKTLAGKPEQKLIKEMDWVRSVVTMALEERTKLGIKVRQPLASLKVKSQISNLKFNKELLGLIKGEVNIKEIVLDKDLESEVWINAEITPELKEEGVLRDITRAIQDLRKKSGLTPKDRPVLLAYGNEKGIEFIKKYYDLISKETNFLKIEIKSSALSSENSASLKTDDIEVEFLVKK